MEKNKSNDNTAYAFVAIVAIVAIVAVVMLFSGTGKQEARISGLNLDVSGETIAGDAKLAGDAKSLSSCVSQCEKLDPKPADCSKLCNALTQDSVQVQ